MAKKSSVNTQYWPDAFIATAQVFLGVAAGTFFTSNIDLAKIIVVISNLIRALLFFYAGGRISK